MADRGSVWIASVTGTDAESYVALLANLVKSSSTYALAALITPLIALVLTPFIAHHLSPTEYGVLALLNGGIALIAAVTHLGQGDALLRAFNYDYRSPREQRQVMATAIVLLAGTTIPVALLVALLAPSISTLLFGSSTRGRLVILAATIVLAYGLTVPAFAWLRSANRPLIYSLLVIGESATILLGTVVLVGVFHLGVAGALIANVAGYAGVVVCTMPVMLVRSGIRIRSDIAWSLLAFGLPLVSGSVSTWVLQLSDRYLLSLMRSLSETATYAVGYTLGSGLTVILIRPFLLAWPTTMYTIAQRENAAELFRLMFRWFALALLFAAFGLALVGRIVLDWLFPAAYRSAAPIIPVVAAGMAFYGAYSLFVTGANLERKTWLLAVYTAVAAGLNIALNVLLIPRFGGMGSAISTLVAYAALAAMAYAGNQAIHPIPFEVGRFLAAIVVTAAMYTGGEAWSNLLGEPWAWPSRFFAWFGCGALLFMMGRGIKAGFGSRYRSPYGKWRGVSAWAGGRISKTFRSRHSGGPSLDLRTDYERSRVSANDCQNVHHLPRRVCMHLLGTARTDVRVMREATALAQAGSKVIIVDIEHDPARPREEELDGVHFRHVMMSRRHVEHYEPTHPVRWLLFKAARMLRVALVVLRTPADVYHAHDVTALPMCYLTALLRRKPLVYDAHELPLVDPQIVSRPLLKSLSTAALKAMMVRCTGLITVSPPLVPELQRRYGGTAAVVVRNVPPYQVPMASDRIRRHLGLESTVRVVLYQGGLQANRGLEVAVLAAKFMAPGTVLVFLGRGHARPELEVTIAREHVADRVKILPPVPYDELLTWTSSADVGLLINTPGFSPNTRMGLPNKLFEYLMAGVPVFASPLDAVVEVLLTYRVGQVVGSLKPDEVGRALDEMLADSDRLAQMRRNALTAAREEFRWDVESRRLVSLYEGLVDGRLTEDSEGAGGRGP